METYTTKIFGEIISVSADWGNAACPVVGCPGGRQVADFRHDPLAALRYAIERLIIESGDEPEDYEDEIEAALEVAEAK